MSEQVLTMNKNLVDASGRPIIIPTVNEVDAEDIPIDERGLQLPEPKGYKILCAIPEAEDTYKGGIANKIAFPHSFRLLYKTEKPFHPYALHPQRGSFSETCQHIKTTAHSHN